MNYTVGITYYGENVDKLKEKVELYKNSQNERNTSLYRRYIKFRNDLDNIEKQYKYVTNQDKERIAAKYNLSNSFTIDRKVDKFCKKYNLEKDSKKAKNYKKYLSISKDKGYDDTVRTFVKFLGFCSKDIDKENIINNISFEDNDIYIYIDTTKPSIVELIDKIACKYKVKYDLLVTSEEDELLDNISEDLFNNKVFKHGFMN